MKIIHTSDWHIGQNFYNFERDDEHRHFFEQLRRIMEERRPDALVVSGDVFHNPAPSAAAQRLFVECVIALHDSSPETVIVITAGNHDSGSRLEAERMLWQRLGVHVIGACRRKGDGTFDVEQFVVEVPGKGYVLAAPYFHPTNYPLATADTERNARQREFFKTLTAAVEESGQPVVMMAHLALAGCDIRGHEESPVGGMLKESLEDLGEGYHYLALGHIHKPQSVSERAYYSGSPLPVSFSEDYTHWVNAVTVSGDDSLPEVEQIELTLLRKVLTLPSSDGGTLEEALESLRGLDMGYDGYVRLLIDQPDTVAADGEDRARKIVDGKRCRFCGVHIKPRKMAAEATETLEINEVEDFTTLSPREIACQSYANAYGGEKMPPELEELMDEVIDEIEAEPLKNADL